MIEQYAWLLVSVLGLTAVFQLAELALPAERRQPIRRILFNAAYAPFILAFVMAAGLAFSPVIAAIVQQSGGGLLPEIAPPGSGPVAILLFSLIYAFVWDLSQYAMHRLQHASPLLWQTHRFHHDETALSAAAQARVHPTSYLLAMTFHLPVILLFGPQVPHFVATFLMFRFWGFLNHANLRVGAGPLAILVALPQWHRIHHSTHDHHRDRNFATFFPVIDWMFGTYYAPRPGEYPPTGLPGEPEPGLRAATIGPFVTWYRMLGPRFRRPAR